MTEDRSRAERKALYERVLRVVDYQTSPKQPPGASRGVVQTILADYGNHESEHVTLALEAAVENGDLLQWTDDGGTTTRYTLPTEQKLRRLHVHAAENGARELSGLAYRRMQEVSG